ncbi:MAG: hypothetical protein M3362_00395 [Acidobacteriota bacterium]|nr:hypothetical protein [Acidobacteriota bacterium]
MKEDLTEVAKLEKELKLSKKAKQELWTIMRLNYFQEDKPLIESYADILRFLGKNYS